MNFQTLFFFGYLRVRKYFSKAMKQADDRMNARGIGAFPLIFPCWQEILKDLTGKIQEKLLTQDENLFKIFSAASKKVTTQKWLQLNPPT